MVKTYSIVQFLAEQFGIESEYYDNYGKAPPDVSGNRCEHFGGQGASLFPHRSSLWSPACSWWLRTNSPQPFSLSFCHSLGG